VHRRATYRDSPAHARYRLAISLLKLAPHALPDLFAIAILVATVVDDREDMAYVQFKWLIGKPRVDHLRGPVPLSQSHLRSILTSWVEHSNRGRPHSSLGPGVPDPPDILAMVQ